MSTPDRQIIRKGSGTNRQTTILLTLLVVGALCWMASDSGAIDTEILLTRTASATSSISSTTATTNGLLMTAAETKAYEAAGQELKAATSSTTTDEELVEGTDSFNYRSPIHRTNYTLPDPVSTEETTVVLVLSSRQHFDRRSAIRDTWANQNNNVYFVIGGPVASNHADMDMSNPLSVSSLLMKEQELYGDIIDSVHPDSYRSLPFKLHFGMKWVVQHLGQVNWVVKADDDQIIRLKLLQYFVLRKFNPDHPSVIGGIITNAQPHTSGKWKEDPRFTGAYYPPWAFGSAGYVVSRGVAEYIGNQDDLYYYQGEDAGLGIWLSESSLQITWIDTPEVNRDKVCDPRFYIIGHDFTVDELRGCFERLGDDVPDRPHIISFSAARKDQHPKVISG